MMVKTKVRNFVISIFEPKKRKFLLAPVRMDFSLAFGTRPQAEIFPYFQKMLIRLSLDCNREKYGFPDGKTCIFYEAVPQELQKELGEFATAEHYPPRNYSGI
jgi:hypothetical protein